MKLVWSPYEGTVLGLMWSSPVWDLLQREPGPSVRTSWRSLQTWSSISCSLWVLPEKLSLSPVLLSSVGSWVCPLNWSQQLCLCVCLCVFAGFVWSRRCVNITADLVFTHSHSHSSLSLGLGLLSSASFWSGCVWSSLVVADLFRGHLVWSGCIWFGLF